MLALDEIHKTKGKICSYVLKCDGDADRKWGCSGGSEEELLRWRKFVQYIYIYLWW